jgi:hypothetical protein
MACWCLFEVSQRYLTIQQIVFFVILVVAVGLLLAGVAVAVLAPLIRPG